jgi:integrase
MSIRALPNGRFQADFADAKRNIPRTKRTFDTKKEAKEWLDAAKQESRRRLLGLRPQRLFGEALAKYLKDLEDVNGDDAAAERQSGHAEALRWPFPFERRWVHLELVPLEDVIPAFDAWLTDLRAVRARRYIGNKVYHLRHENGQDVWYLQPHPESAATPPIRERVTDPVLLRQLQRNDPFATAVNAQRGEAFTAEQIRAAIPGYTLRRARQRLNRAVSRGQLVQDTRGSFRALKPLEGPPQRGRGPYANQTLRVRQILVREVLEAAWKRWSWMEHNIAGKIELLPLPEGRETWLLPEQLARLTAAAPVWLRRAVCGAAWIGWRRSNVLRLEWANVIWPERDASGQLIRAGLFYVPGAVTKNKKPLAQPMSERVEALFLECWEDRNGDSVFHKDGKCVADINFRKLWRRLRREANLPADLRWHDLRHTWASHLAIAGVSDRQIQEAGGWQSLAMVKKYTHLNVEHLQGVVDAYKG